MEYNKKYLISPSPSFEQEFINIYNYIAFTLNSPNSANKLYHQITNAIYSLQYYPERYTKILTLQNLRKLTILNYVIIYKINNNSNQIFILHIFHNTQNYFKFL